MASPKYTFFDTWNDGKLPGDGGREAAFTLTSFDVTVQAPNLLYDSGGHTTLRSRITGPMVTDFGFFEVHPPTGGVFSGGVFPSEFRLYDPLVTAHTSFAGMSYAAGVGALTQGIDSNGRPNPVLRFYYDDFNGTSGSTSAILHATGTNRLQIQNPTGAIVFRNANGRYEMEGIYGERIAMVGYYLSDGKPIDFNNAGHIPGQARTPLSATTMAASVDPLVISTYLSGAYSNKAKFDSTGNLYVPGIYLGASIGAIVNAGAEGPAPVSDADVRFERAASGVARLVNGTNPTGLLVYNTLSGANSEYAGFQWFGNTLYWGTSKSGTGVARPLTLMTGGVGRWTITASGHVEATTDNSYDIGSVTARPRTIYAATSVISAGSLAAGSAATVSFASRTKLASPADGQLLLTNDAGTAFSGLLFGGTTSAFPSIVRNATVLEARLADGSAFAPLKGKLTTDTGYTGTPVTPTGYLILYDAAGTAYKVPAVLA